MRGLSTFPWRLEGVGRPRVAAGPFALIAAPLVAVAARLIDPPTALGCLVVAFVVWLLWMRRAGRVGREHARIILRVTGGVLHVARGGDRVAREVPLAAIRDVELDRKTIIVVGSSRTSTEVFSDRTSARIQLLVDHGEPVRLADEFVHYDYCVQHFGKVRSFLRTHGWEPEGERTSAV